MEIPQNLSKVPFDESDHLEDSFRARLKRILIVSRPMRENVRFARPHLVSYPGRNSDATVRARDQIYLIGVATTCNRANYTLGKE